MIRVNRVIYFVKVSATMKQPTTPTVSGPSQIQAQTLFTLALAASGRMTEESLNACHLAVTTFIVKGLHPFATVDSKGFR